MTHSEEVNLTNKITNIILANREMAEKTPENLLQFEEAKKYYNEVGPKMFSLLVTSILDDE